MRVLQLAAAPGSGRQINIAPGVRVAEPVRGGANWAAIIEEILGLWRAGREPTAPEPAPPPSEPEPMWYEKPITWLGIGGGLLLLMVVMKK